MLAIIFYLSLLGCEKCLARKLFHVKALLIKGDGMVTKTDKSCSLVFHCGFFSEVGGRVRIFLGDYFMVLAREPKREQIFLTGKEGN